MSALHAEQTTANGLHIVTKWEYNTTALRDAASYTSADVGGIARVGTSAPYTFHVLTNETGPAWASIATASAPEVGLSMKDAIFHVDYNNPASWEPNQATVWTDLIGGTVGTPSGVLEAKGKLGFDGATSVVDFGSTSAAMAGLFSGGGSLEVTVAISSDGELNEGRIIDAGDNGNNWALYTTGESGGYVKISFFHEFSGTSGVWESTVAEVPIGDFVTIGVLYNSDSTANNATIHWEGALIPGGTTRSTAPIGTAVETSSGVALTVGNDDSGARSFDGSIETITAWDVTVNAQMWERNAAIRAGRFAQGGIGYDPSWSAAGQTVYGTGANRGQLLAIGTAGQVLTVNSGATAPEWATPAGGSTDTAVASAHNGQGSTNTRVQRFTNTTDATSALSWTDSASNGTYCTVDEVGTYIVVWSGQRSGGTDYNISINVGSTTEMNTNTFDGTYIQAVQRSIASTMVNIVWQGPIAASDVIWFSGESSSCDFTSSANYGKVSITKISSTGP